MEQYISKELLVAEINRVLNSYDPNEITSGRYALISLRDFINTLEVKGVDLEKEFDSWYYHLNIPENYNIPQIVMLRDIIEKTSKHFFELGLKAQKGE